MAASVKIRVTGGDFWRQLNPVALNKAANLGFRDAMKRINRYWASEARANSPLDTGQLRRSIRAVDTKFNLAIDLEWYGKVLEFKTGPHYGWLSRSLDRVLSSPATKAMIRRSIDARVRQALRLQGGRV